MLKLRLMPPLTALGVVHQWATNCRPQCHHYPHCLHNLYATSPALRRTVRAATSLAARIAARTRSAPLLAWS